MAERNYSPHQQKIIKRYYENHDGIKFQRLSDLVADLYLAEGKKQERLWKQAEEVMQSLEVPATRIEHILAKRDPVLLAAIVKEIQGQGK